jgi:hypothetical protein
LRARDDLERAGRGELRLSPKGWYETCLAAGYTRDEAEAVHNAAFKAAVKRGETNIETL